MSNGVSLAQGIVETGLDADALQSALSALGVVVTDGGGGDFSITAHENGSITINAGGNVAAVNGGDITLIGGTSGGADTDGGSANLGGGSGGAGNGGSVNITGGNSTGGFGGDVTVAPGTGDDANGSLVISNANVDNGTVACVLTPTSGPTGAQAAVQGWIRVVIGGTPRFIPFW